MQRLAASVLLAIISFLLTMPLFGAGASDIPECCRRLGRHHCLMSASDSGSAQSLSPTLRAARPHCPFTPYVGVLPLHPAALASNPARLIFADAVRHPATHAQTEARYRISSIRAHQKRGPPRIA